MEISECIRQHKIPLNEWMFKFEDEEYNDISCSANVWPC